MLNITKYYRKENQNYNEVSPCISQNSHYQKETYMNAEEGVEKKEPSYTICGNINWYRPYEEQYVHSSEKTP